MSGLIFKVPLDIEARRDRNPPTFKTYLYTPRNGVMILSEHHIVKGKHKIVVRGFYNPKTDVVFGRDKEGVCTGAYRLTRFSKEEAREAEEFVFVNNF